MKVYVAGKMSAHSHYADHTWRDEFLKEIKNLNGLDLISLDPTSASKSYDDLEMVFGSDVHMISEIDAVIVYASDDISIGGSQEILIAKYFGKPVIAYAPYGGRFNGGTKQAAGRTLTNYKHPFLFTTCDVVCGTLEEVAEQLVNLDKLEVKKIDLIDQAKRRFETKHLKQKLYEERIID